MDGANNDHTLGQTDAITDIKERQIVPICWENKIVQNFDGMTE